jgi:hypothetical protein
MIAKIIYIKYKNLNSILTPRDNFFIKGFTNFNYPKNVLNYPPSDLIFGTVDAPIESENLLSYEIYKPIKENFDPHLGNITVDKLSRFSSINIANKTYTNNPNFLLKDLDYSAFPVQTRASTSILRRGALITPQMITWCEHCGIPALDGSFKIHFIDNNGNWIERSAIGYNSLKYDIRIGSNTPNYLSDSSTFESLLDLSVILLNEPVTTIEPIRLVDVDYLNEYRVLRDSVTNSWLFDYPFSGRMIYNKDNRISLYGKKYKEVRDLLPLAEFGNSGSPGFFFFNNKPHLTNIIQTSSAGGTRFNRINTIFLLKLLIKEMNEYYGIKNTMEIYSNDFKNLNFLKMTDLMDNRDISFYTPPQFLSSYSPRSNHAPYYYQNFQPTIIGQFNIGEILMCEEGIYDCDPYPTFEFQWQINSGEGFVDIVGETSRYYTVKENDINKNLRCKVTATNIAGNLITYTEQI